MMLFKLSVRNMKKSFKDYAIYFLTLILGVAIFYMFNSLDSQEAMLQVSKSTRDIIRLMIEMLSIVSVLVAIVLGLLIVYANNFLINRRKKEFGIYRLLGLSKWQISQILFLETIFVGVISLIVGIIIGIFGSQFMSVLVGKLFNADMSRFEFVFSKAACIKTCIYFAIMYVAVIFFNMFMVSKYKLITLLTASKKNERIKIKNPIVCVLIFLIAASILGYCYYIVSQKANTLNTGDKVLKIILLGILSTILVFWSLSGFVLKIISAKKETYLKGTNIFVLRQINNKINTNVLSVSVICLMLFMTITILSSALSLRNTMEKGVAEMTPVHINAYKKAFLENKPNQKHPYSEERIQDSKKGITDTITENGFNMKYLKDVIEIPIYAIDDITLEKTLGNALETVKSGNTMVNFKFAEEIIKVSDYNKIARLYKLDEYRLLDNEYMIICNFDTSAAARNLGLKDYTSITINGKELFPKYDECKDGFIEISTSRTNTGIILVPDNCQFDTNQQEKWLLVANCNTNDEEESERIQNDFLSFLNSLYDSNDVLIDGYSKHYLIESSVGLATIITFIAIYLGIIFLIASSAILALKQLTESSDNKERYLILRKIGLDEKMINKTLFNQIGIFFLMPLILAVIHSVFGIQFGIAVMSGLASKEELIPSAIVTMVVTIIIYGLYFIAIYLESKNIIKDDE